MPIVWINDPQKTLGIYIKILGGDTYLLLPCLFVLTGDRTVKVMLTAETKYPNSKIKIVVRALLFGNASLAINSIMKVRHGAKNSYANFSAKALMFQNSSARITPAIEMDEHNATAEHSVWTGKILPEEMFYLQSRGLTKKQIYKLFIGGLTKEILSYLPKNKSRGLIQRISKLTPKQLA